MAAEMLEFIERLGASAWVSSSWDEAAIKESLQTLDLLITLGGDGSMVRAAVATNVRFVDNVGRRWLHGAGSAHDGAASHADSGH